MNKTKVLVLADYGCSTGFGQVASNIITRLNATGLYDFTIIGINYDPANEIDLERWPGRIIPAITVGDMNNARGPDVYGRQKVLNELGKGIYDIFFSIQDTFILGTIMPQILETKEALDKKFSTVFYYPIDAQPKPEWITDVVAHIDFPVPYTEYAAKESIKVMPKLNLQQPIYHGTNLKDFHYVEDRQDVAEFRKQYFAGNADGKFLVVNINRNQPRKDIPRSLMILKELKKRGFTKAIMYLHMAHDDAGGNILVMAEQLGLKINEDFILPSPKVFDPNQGLPIELVNMIYNAADACLTTTLGEGWGLSITEAMATRTPIIAPNNTSITEILKDERGLLVPSGDNPSMWFSLGAQDNERLRPLMDIGRAIDAIVPLMKGKLPDLDKALAWSQNYSWDAVCEDWKRIFQEAANLTKKLDAAPKQLPISRQQRRALERKQKKVGI